MSLTDAAVIAGVVALVCGLAIWAAHRRRRPAHAPALPHGAIVIHYSGQRTTRPQIIVGAFGLNGAQSVYTYPADDVGEAKATLHGAGLARILCVRLVDERSGDLAMREVRGVKPL